MALAYSREFLFNRLKLCTGEDQTAQMPSDLSNLVNYAGSLHSNDEAHSIATSLSDSSASPSSSAPIHNSITFELGQGEDEDSFTDGESPRRSTDIDTQPSRPEPHRQSSRQPSDLQVGDPDLSDESQIEGMRFLDDDDSDLEEQLLLVAAGQSPIPSRQDVPRKLSFYEPEALDFSRRSPVPSLHKSLLSSAISSIGNGDPLNQFISAAATAESVLVLGVYFQFSSTPSTPMPLKVRGGATVHQVIGYALKTYRESHPLESQNPNWYNVRLHDEDGDPDDDFPALERKREISLYSLDEIVVVPASQSEFEQNNCETPFEVSAPVGIDAQEDDNNKEITVRVYMFPFDNVLSNIYWCEVLAGSTTLERILELVCTAKRLSLTEYVVRTINTRHTNQPGTTIAALKPPQMALYDLNINSDDEAPVLILEIMPKRAIEDESDSICSPSKRKGTLESNPSSSYAPAPIPNVTGINFQQFGYYKYPIWRRQHVSFLGRQERELAIDGEYVYIMPPSDRSLLERPKTTTFHIRQVIRCKQSSKVPVYLKIFVMKQTGPKRYDIDCLTEEDCVEIVERINRLMRNF